MHLSRSGGSGILTSWRGQSQHCDTSVSTRLVLILVMVERESDLIRLVVTAPEGRGLPRPTEASEAVVPRA